MTVIASSAVSIGWEAADFTLGDYLKTNYSLKDFTQKRALLIVFTCNHCPYAKASWPKLITLYHEYRNDVSFVAINSNDSHMYPEDSRSVMGEKVSEWNIPFPYLRDASQTVAHAYKAQCTPDPYLFLCDGGVASLVYHGRIDDNWQDPENIRVHDLKDAIDAALNNSDPLANQHPSVGCSIKWKNEG